MFDALVFSDLLLFPCPRCLRRSFVVDDILLTTALMKGESRYEREYISLMTWFSTQTHNSKVLLCSHTALGILRWKATRCACVGLEICSDETYRVIRVFLTGSSSIPPMLYQWTTSILSAATTAMLRSGCTNKRTRMRQGFAFSFLRMFVHPACSSEMTIMWSLNSSVH